MINTNAQKITLSILIKQNLIESYKEANSEHDDDFESSDSDELDEAW